MNDNPENAMSLEALSLAVYLVVWIASALGTSKGSRNGAWYDPKQHLCAIISPFALIAYYC